MHPWVRAAVDHFGLTDDPLKAGFVLLDGGLLDLITNGRAGVRSVCHDTITAAIPALLSGDAPRMFNDATAALRIHVADRGTRGRRLVCLGIMLQRPPNRPQIRALQEIGAQQVAVDVETIDGRVLGTNGPYYHDAVEDFLAGLPELVSTTMARHAGGV